MLHNATSISIARVRLSSVKADGSFKYLEVRFVKYDIMHQPLGLSDILVHLHRALLKPKHKLLVVRNYAILRIQYKLFSFTRSQVRAADIALH